MTINSDDSHASAIRYGNIVYLSLSSGSQIGYSASGMSYSSSCVCPLLVFLLPTLASLSLLFSLIFFSSISHLSYLSASLPFVYYSFGRSRLSLSFFFFCAKRLPPSSLHSGGEASIVIVPHQRRSAINLSPCRAESERCSPRADHTRNTGRAINLCPLAIV